MQTNNGKELWMQHQAMWTQLTLFVCSPSIPPLLWCLPHCTPACVQHHGQGPAHWCCVAMVTGCLFVRARGVLSSSQWFNIQTCPSSQCRLCSVQIRDDRCKASPLAVKRSLKKKLGVLNQTNRCDVVYWRKDAGCNGQGGECGTARERARMRLA